MPIDIKHLKANIETENAHLENQRGWVAWLQGQLIREFQISQERGTRHYVSEDWKSLVEKKARLGAKTYGVTAFLDVEGSPASIAFKSIESMSKPNFLERNEWGGIVRVEAINPHTEKNITKGCVEATKLCADTIATNEITKQSLDQNSSSENIVPIFIDYTPVKEADKLMKEKGSIQEKQLYASIKLKENPDYKAKDLVTEPAKNASIEKKIEYAAFRMKIAAEKAQSKYAKKIQELNKQDKAEDESLLEADADDLPVEELSKKIKKSQQERNVKREQYKKESNLLDDSIKRLGDLLKPNTPKTEATLYDIVIDTQNALTNKESSLLREFRSFLYAIKIWIESKFKDKFADKVSVKMESIMDSTSLLTGFEKHKKAKLEKDQHNEPTIGQHNKPTIEQHEKPKRK